MSAWICVAHCSTNLTKKAEAYSKDASAPERDGRESGERESNTTGGKIGKNRDAWAIDLLS